MSRLRKLHRSSITGRIITPEDANANPDTTTAETIEPPFDHERLNLIAEAMACANKHGIRETIQRLRA